MSRDDDQLRISDEDTRFVEKLRALYRPPAATSAERARFVARLEERIARGRAPRTWLIGSAAAAALALVLALWPSQQPPERTSVQASSDESSSAEESLLLLANGPLDDPDEALPADYRTLASLLE